LNREESNSPERVASPLKNSRLNDEREKLKNELERIRKSNKELKKSHNRARKELPGVVTEVKQLKSKLKAV
jgi:archaellum component FlaC